MMQRYHSPVLFLLLSLSGEVTHDAYALASVASSGRLSALSSVKVLYDSTNNWHRSIQYHPEQPERIKVCIEALEEKRKNGLTSVDLINVASLPAGEETTGHSAPFTQEELEYARSMLVQAHSEEHVQHIETRCRSSRQRRIDDGKNPLGFVGYIDDDTYLTTESYDVCLRATATWIRAVNIALDHTISKKKDVNESLQHAAVALTRPPGHHATSRLSNGFCIFNFAAAAALHALQSDPVRTISVLDWDVHYGQGVADILQHHERARYVSIHQTPAFPYEGEKRGIHGIHKNIMTVPIPADTTWTCGYKHIFEDVALPFLYSSYPTESSGDKWEPDLVIVCAGYDALTSDELASVSLTAKDYGHMSRSLLNRIGLRTDSTSDETKNRTPPSLMLGLEGGYQLGKGAAGGNLADAVMETVEGLLE
mmetsp:Transcript_8250/g.14905  ORF Transcript_8250/g.14905 Transcript_8250/m.14905 type:complete len:424 (-) Transcript_8250:1059-2330(-)